MSEEIICLFVWEMDYRVTTNQVKNAFKQNNIGNVVAVRYQIYTTTLRDNGVNGPKGAYVYLTLYSNSDFVRGNKDFNFAPFGQAFNIVWHISELKDIPIPCKRFETPLVHKLEKRIVELERELERTVTQVEKLTVAFVETRKTHGEAIDAIKKKINSLIDRDNETQKDVYRLKLDVKDAFEWINNRAAEAPSWSSARIVKRSCY